MKGITGIDERLWPLVFIVLAIILLFWAKNLYKLLEKLMMVLVMIIILSFLLNLMLLTKPDVTEVLAGFIPKVQKDDSQLDVIAALVATTFALTEAFYQSYLVQDKGWEIAGMRKGLNDTYMGIFMLGLISTLIILIKSAIVNERAKCLIAVINQFNPTNPTNAIKPPLIPKSPNVVKKTIIENIVPITIILVKFT